MANKTIVLKEETTKLFNEARVKYLNNNPNSKFTDDIVIRQTIKHYLEVKNDNE